MPSSGDSTLPDEQTAAGSDQAAPSDEQSSHGEDEYPSSTDSGEDDSESEDESDLEAARREARLAEKDPTRWYDVRCVFTAGVLTLVYSLVLNRQNPEQTETDAWLWEINDYNLGLKYPKEIDLKHVKCLFEPRALSNEFGTIVMGRNGIATRLVVSPLHQPIIRSSLLISHR